MPGLVSKPPQDAEQYRPQLFRFVFNGLLLYTHVYGMLACVCLFIRTGANAPVQAKA